MSNELFFKEGKKKLQGNTWGGKGIHYYKSFFVGDTGREGRVAEATFYLKR